MADEKRVASETGTDQVEVEVGILIGWNKETGEFMVQAPTLSAQDVVYMLEHAKTRVLGLSNPNKAVEPRVKSYHTLPGKNGGAH